MEVILDQYNPNKRKIEVFVDAEVKEKLKQGAKKRGILLKKYLNQILERAVRMQEGVQNEESIN